MGPFFLRRLGLVLPSLWAVVTLSFFLIHLIPGDPVDFVLGEQATVQDKQVLRHQLGLDQSLIHQYRRHLVNLVRGDWGQSLQSHVPVLSEVTSRFPATAELAFSALILSLAWGLPWGVWAGAHLHSWWNKSADGVGLIGMSLPGVFVGPALIYLFAMRWDWFPVSERGGWDHLLLPAASLALPLGAVVLRMTRAAVQEVGREDYIRTARAKGASERVVFFKHALRNALTPIVTVVGLQLGAMITGTVITETIFDWPGIGTLLYTAIQQRDYPLVQGCVLWVACLYVLVHFLTDMAYGWVNPRIRHESEE